MGENMPRPSLFKRGHIQERGGGAGKSSPTASAPQASRKFLVPRGGMAGREAEAKEPQVKRAPDTNPQKEGTGQSGSTVLIIFLCLTLCVMMPTTYLY